MNTTIPITATKSQPISELNQDYIKDIINNAVKSEVQKITYNILEPIKSIFDIIKVDNNNTVIKLKKNLIIDVDGDLVLNATGMNILQGKLVHFNPDEKMDVSNIENIDDQLEIQRIMYCTDLNPNTEPLETQEHICKCNHSTTQDKEHK